MFFLTTYGVLNITAGIERLLESPSFRPKFKVHWSFSLLGALGCISVMFLINAVATGIAFLFVIIIFIWLERRELESAWGDVRRGIWMAITRAGLMRMSVETEAKTWRPHPLVLSGAPTKRFHLIEFASSLTHNRGILTISTVLTTENISPERQHDMEENIRDFLSKRSIQALVRVTTATGPFEGSKKLVDSYGLGALVPNTIILGDSENKKFIEQYCGMVSHFHRQQRNVIVVHDNKENGFGDKKLIDVWWGGLKGNGGLMMILAYLLQSSRAWWDADVRIKMVVDNDSAAESAQQNLNEIIQRIRINAEARVLVSNGKSFNRILHESSGDADLVLMGMAEPDENFTAYYETLQERLKDLPTTIMVLAAEEISFGEVLMQEDTFQQE
ncbi:MAG: hypothetical protein R3220_07700 [Balneolaceae bacterium]|nr:hypothetical protein [Balneolaceae bacterium]